MNNRKIIPGNTRARLSSSGNGGSDMNQLNARVAKLESDVSHMMTDIIEIKNDIKQLDAKFEDKFSKLDTKLEDKFNKLDAKFEDKFNKLDAKFEDKINKLDAKFEDKIDKLDAKFESQFYQLDGKITYLDQRSHSNFKWLIGTFLVAFITSFGGLSVIMAHGFHWI